MRMLRNDQGKQKLYLESTMAVKHTQVHSQSRWAGSSLQVCLRLGGTEKTMVKGTWRIGVAPSATISTHNYDVSV